MDIMMEKHGIVTSQSKGHRNNQGNETSMQHK